MLFGFSVLDIRLGVREASVTREDLDRLWADPKNWDIVYRCANDPRIIVPRRRRWMGWTIKLCAPIRLACAFALCRRRGRASARAAAVQRSVRAAIYRGADRISCCLGGRLALGGFAFP